MTRPDDLFAARRGPTARAGHEATAMGAVRLASVVRVSLVLYALVAVAMIAVGSLLWLAATWTGVVADVESAIAGLFAMDRFEFRPHVLLRIAVVGGAVFVLVATAATTALGIAYNVAGRLVGGIEAVPAGARHRRHHAPAPRARTVHRSGRRRAAADAARPPAHG